MSRHDDELDDVEIAHDGHAGETKLAMAFRQGTHRFARTTIWIPKSVIVDHDENSVIVKGWFAEKEGYV